MIHRTPTPHKTPTPLPGFTARLLSVRGILRTRNASMEFHKNPTHLNCWSNEARRLLQRGIPRIPPPKRLEQGELQNRKQKPTPPNWVAAHEACSPDFETHSLNFKKKLLAPDFEAKRIRGGVAGRFQSRGQPEY